MPKPKYHKHNVGDVVKANPELMPTDDLEGPYGCMNKNRYIVAKVELNETSQHGGVIWITNYDGSEFPEEMRDHKDAARYKNNRKIIWFNGERLIRDEFLTAVRKALKNAKT